MMVLEQTQGCDVKLSIRRPRYLAGQHVEAMISVHNSDMEKKIYVQNLSVEFVGLERVDLQWVKPYNDGRQPVQKDSRKQVFEIFKCTQTLLEEQLVCYGESLRCAVRFRLPSSLPPSFKGKAVRYMYHAIATAKFGTVLSEEQSSEVPELLVDKYSDVLCKKPFLIQPRKNVPTTANGGVSVFQSSAQPTDLGTTVPLIEYESGSATPELSIQFNILEEEGDRHVLHSSNSLPHTPFTSMGGRVKLSVDQKQFQELLSQNGGAVGSVGEGEEDEYSASGDGGQQYLMAASSFGSQIGPGGDPIPAMGQMNTKTYALRLADTLLMRCSMNPSMSVVKPGASISGVMDFRQSENNASNNTRNGIKVPRVHQVILSLETEESVQDEFAVNSRASQGGSVVRCLYEEQQFAVSHVQTISFTLSIPPLATPSFSTKIIRHKWLLRFELIAHTEGKRQPDITLWKLPLLVHPL
eukprot:TRINITY_DN1307_c0_g1_i3.p1 TRINITY_DN1307_c0_g1~~TRINITY_DN1307_c0_g1_i3.p1  ORF type:complete len:468 (-),score=62.31 TRINITY_DN1307_c0_g1_i3:420-1823(-)